MVTIGLDAHKRTHTVVAVDSAGRKLAERTTPTSPAGHLELLRWARRWRERTWALEDCRHLTRRLERDLLAAGEIVVRVPPKLMAGVRRSNREPGKSDPIDALSVARAALREPDLPMARLDGLERELRLLVDHREDLVVDRTGHQERLRWFLVELGIAEPPARSLDRPAILDRMDGELAASDRARRPLRPRPAREDPGAHDGDQRARTRDPSPRRTGRPLAPRSHRLRSPDRGQARRPDRPGSLASVRGPPSLATTARLPYRSGRETRSATVSTVAATASSTSPSIGSPSPNSSALARAASTWPSGWPLATPRPRPSGPSVDVSATRSTAGS